MLAGVDLALQLGVPVKLNTVLMKGTSVAFLPAETIPSVAAECDIIIILPTVNQTPNANVFYTLCRYNKVYIRKKRCA